MAGLGAVAGAFLAALTGHGSITINSSSPLPYVALGSAGVAISLGFASYLVSPGPYHPPAATIGAADGGAHVFRVAWRF
jgi:hypothetical protein